MIRRAPRTRLTFGVKAFSLMGNLVSRIDGLPLLFPFASVSKEAVMSRRILSCVSLCLCFLAVGEAARAADPQWVVYEGKAGPGLGKQIVLISGDEEYRSEECLPQLGKILAERHGFKCTVLFAINPATGEIDPNQNNNIPGLDSLATADLMIIATRFRDLPDEQMKHIVDYVESGRPVIGLRTATHAFNLNKDSAYQNYHWALGGETDGGFGRRVLGESWISHHGHHGKQSTRGVVVPGREEHPILRGIQTGDVWGPTDVYGVRLPQPKDCQPLVLGQVLTGMKPEDPPLEGEKNDPMMPVAWTNTFLGSSGKSTRVFTTTMGAAQDLQNEGFRRLLVNATYWCLEMEDKISKSSESTSFDLVGQYVPSPFSFGGFVKGVKPADHLK